MFKKISLQYFTLVAAVGLLVSVSVLSARCSSDSDTATFDIGMVTFPGYAPLYLAKEKGFFGDLDVRLHRIEEIASIRAGVASGELEAYLATPDIALDSNTRPLGAAVWAIDESAGGDGVVVGPEIKNLAELKGRAIAAEPGLPPRFVLLYLLHQNKLSAGDVQLKDLSTQDSLSAFLNGSVDAAALYEPYLTTAKNKRKGSRIILSSAQTPGMIVDLIFLRDDQLGDSETIQKLVSGWLEAMAYIKESPDDAFKIMAAAFKIPVPEFKDIVSGIKWLDMEDNKRLFGETKGSGTLPKTFAEVRDVLRRHRSDVYMSKPEDYIRGDFVRSK